MRRYVTTLLFCFNVVPSFADQPSVIPPEASQLIEAKGCVPVSDYFTARPNTQDEDAPYALVAGGAGKLQVAVWCADTLAKPDPQRTYSLLLRIDESSNPLSSCPREIDGIKYIGGLQFVDVSEDANWYRFLDTHKRIGSSDTLNSRGIMSTYDGVGAIYVCVGGRWAMRGLH